MQQYVVMDATHSAHVFLFPVSVGLKLSFIQLKLPLFKQTTEQLIADVVLLYDECTAIGRRRRRGHHHHHHHHHRNMLHWYEHVLRKDDDDWVKKCMEYEVEGTRPRGRPKRTWREVVLRGL